MKTVARIKHPLFVLGLIVCVGWLFTGCATTQQMTTLQEQVQEAMTRRVITVEPEQTVEACMVLMTDKHIRHLPVIEEGRLIGIVSIGDIVKAVIEAQRLTIEELETYITSGR